MKKSTVIIISSAAVLVIAAVASILVHNNVFSKGKETAGEIPATLTFGSLALKHVKAGDLSGMYSEASGGSENLIYADDKGMYYEVDPENYSLRSFYDNSIRLEDINGEPCGSEKALKISQDYLQNIYDYSVIPDGRWTVEDEEHDVYDICLSQYINDEKMGDIAIFNVYGSGDIVYAIFQFDAVLTEEEYGKLVPEEEAVRTAEARLRETEPENYGDFVFESVTGGSAKGDLFWRVVYDNPNSEYADKRYIYIDRQTGEITRTDRSR